MEVGLLGNLSSLEKSFNSNRLTIDDIQAKNVLDVKLAAQNKQLYNDQDDEGEIMLLAMILLQLHGVKLPSSEDLSSSESENKKKRQRTSPDQLAILEQIFQTDKMPNQQTRVQLADQLGMSSRRVQIWFQNKRAKVKRSNQKDNDCSSPSGDLNSSCSLSPPSSPSSPFAFESPSTSVSPVDESVSSPQQTTSSKPTLPTTDASSTPLKTLTASIDLSSLLSTITNATATSIPPAFIVDAPRLKQQFSFVETQPLLSASY